MPMSKIGPDELVGDESLEVAWAVVDVVSSTADVLPGCALVDESVEVDGGGLGVLVNEPTPSGWQASAAVATSA